MLGLHQFFKTNPRLYAYDGKTKIPNASSAVERLKKLKPGDFVVLDGIAAPGKEAQQVISDLRAEAHSTFPGLREADWSAILVEIITADPSRSRADSVQDMLRLALNAGGS